MSSTVYPFALDDDSNLPRIDDNLSILGVDLLNAIRSAIFALETYVGVNPNGTKGSLADRINVALNGDGSLKASALTSIGLVTLPITNFQIGSNAGINESKLALTHTTSDLYTLIQANSTLINSVAAFLTITSSDLIGHVAGATLKQNGSPNRHVASHIDLNAIPSDPRDLSFVWSGLQDSTGALRTATTVAAALLAINNDLTNHENSTSGAHTANAIEIDTDNFTEIPPFVTDVQKLADYIDDNEVIKIGEHRATQHSNGIPSTARSQSPSLPDGYRENVVPPTSATTYLVHSPAVSPVDSISNGDDVIRFVPNDAGFVFDSQFRLVAVGDTVRVNYGNGVEAAFLVESVRYTPGSEWVVRINGTNLFDSGDGYALARIDRSRYDVNTSGVLAVAAGNATPSPSFGSILSGLIVGDARAAGALGLGFDAGQLDATHYNLWLELYPTGNPVDRVVSMPAVDVTGNAGITPGKYTLDSIVQAANNSLRMIGFNLRFMAYQYKGEFGIKMTDGIGGAAFAIIKGSNSSGSLSAGSFTNNVISEVNDTYDPLGLGVRGSDSASPAYQTSFIDATSAQLPTKVLVPLKNRNFVVNGQRKDSFAPTYLANKDGYWDGYISARTPVGLFTVETTYHIPLDLKAAGLKAGRSITIQPAIKTTDPLFADVDYGRFIIKSVNFPAICPGVPQSTEITVINGIHAFGNGFGFSSSPPLPVRLHFGYDSVGFDFESILDTSPTATPYRRHHEVYVTQDGRTFSHERARLPIQTEDAQPSWLATTRWHIKEVSAKLRGYRDASATQYNKFIRLYILDYNSTTGEFDGYLGQRFSIANVNVTSVGSIVKGRKNITTRFYDETNVDYIDVEFTDDASPGTSVLSTNLARFVDIEIFPSLRLDDEVMLLAVAEVNWAPQTNNDTVQWVRDRRSLGSIDEAELNDATILTLSAGDRYLHQNGVIRGLDLDSISTVANSGEVFFKGGVALVNGRIVPCNNSSVTIPKIYPNGTSLPQSVNWAICVNERGNLTPVLLTTTKQQSFMTAGSSNYLVPSVTFQELVDVRKELTVIATSNVTIASLTVNSVTDVRRVLLNGTSSSVLTWAGDRQQSANFQSIAALKNWILQYGSIKNRVKVIGDIPITTTIDLTGFTKEVLIDGSEGSFTVNTNKGILVGGNVTFDSCTFNYQDSGPAMTAGDEINSGNGCLYGAAGTDISSLTVKNCIFNYTRAAQRPPFINLELNKEQVLDGIKIIDNQFIDIIPANLNQGAVAIFFLNAGAGTNPAILSNSTIARNRCSHRQGVYITTTIGSTGAEAPGMNVINTTIENNVCGKIGYLTSAYENTLTSLLNLERTNGLTIRGNTCSIIANIYGNSNVLVNSHIFYTTASVTITDNRCSWIQMINMDATGATPTYSAAQITNNYLFANDPGLLLLGLFNNAITFGSSVATTVSQTTCRGNVMNFGRFDGVTYGYDGGIISDGANIISQNIIKGMNASGLGMSINGTGSGTKRCIITENQIYRGSAALLAYIKLSTAANLEGLCCDNYFDSTTIDGASTLLITAVPIGWIATRNKNQTFIANVAAAAGNWTVQYALVPDAAGTVNSSVDTLLTEGSTPQINTARCEYQDTSATIRFKWIIPLLEVLPEGAYLTSIAFTYNNTIATGTIQILHHDSNDTVVNTTVSIGSTGDQAEVLDVSSAGRIRYGNSIAASTPYLLLNSTINSGSTLQLDIKNLQLTYQF